MSNIPPTICCSIDKDISDLCPFSIARNRSQNHCAHYVSHIMNYELPGVTCKNFTWDDKQKSEAGATLRVDDLFKASPKTGLLADKPTNTLECLIFVTLRSNVSTVGNKLTMGNHPRKHVGLLFQGKVWNYSNTHNKVVADTIELFKSRFSNAYRTAGTTVEFYFGKLL